MSIVHQLAAFVVLTACLTPSHNASAQGQPVMSLEGDGLQVRVLELNEETGVARGELQLGQAKYSFTGKVRESGETTIVEGTFKAGNESFPFTSKRKGEADLVTFETGGTTYRLKVQPAADPAVPDVKIPDKRIPVAPEPPPKRAGVVKLKRHAFPDVNMGNAPAYTMLVPEGWSAKGQVEWQDIFKVYYPQPKIVVESPEGGRIRYVPPSYIQYFPAQKGMAQQGMPPPEDFPRWYAEALPKGRANVSNVRLIGAKRDPQEEATEEERHRQSGLVPGTKMIGEYHQLTLEYDEAGARRREEVLVKFVRYPNMADPHIRTYHWGMFPQWMVSAPADRFDAMKGQLYAIAGTTMETPEWFTAKQAVLAENARVRNAAIWDQIRKRGEQIKNMHVSQPEREKYNDTVTKDPQRERLKTIYETEDLKDTDGQIVNLPMYYQHVYSDGNGHYVQSNNSQDKPGESWTDIKGPK